MIGEKDQNVVAVIVHVVAVGPAVTVRAAVVVTTVLKHWWQW